MQPGNKINKFELTKIWIKTQNSQQLQTRGCYPSIQQAILWWYTRITSSIPHQARVRVMKRKVMTKMRSPLTLGSQRRTSSIPTANKNTKRWGWTRRSGAWRSIWMTGSSTVIRSKINRRVPTTWLNSPIYSADSAHILRQTRGLVGTTILRIRRIISSSWISYKGKRGRPLETPL